MGYTIYWTEPNKAIMDMEELARIAQVAKAAAQTRYRVTRVDHTEHDHTIGKLIITGGCETFTLFSDSTSLDGQKNARACFRFVKTRGCEYTSLIVTILVYLLMKGVILSVSHDGDAEELVEEVQEEVYLALGQTPLDRDHVTRTLKKVNEEEEEMTEEEACFLFASGLMRSMSEAEVW